MSEMVYHGVSDALDLVKRISITLYEEVSCTFYNHKEVLAIVGAFYAVHKGLNIFQGCYQFIKEFISPCFINRTKRLKHYGEWAVVTGSTDGIGKAYAEELARYGVNILLMGRNLDKLQKVSDHITATYGVKTRFIEADFSLGHQVFPAVREGLRDVDVGILVNNAGVVQDYPDIVTEVPEEQLWDIINVNIAATVMMVHIVLPGMVQRRRGAIINIASATYCRPVPLVTVYASSKTFLDRFSHTLNYEYGSKGIFVQSVTPFFTITKMISFFGKCMKRSILVPLAEDFAHQAVKTIGVSRRTAGYWSHSLQLSLATWVPEWMWVSVVTYIFGIGRREYLAERSRCQKKE